MVSVTKRIKAIKQPYGGYLPIKDFNHIQLKIEDELYSEESISPGLIGTAIDYIGVHGLNATIVRSMGLKNGDFTGDYRETKTGIPDRAKSLPRADVAHFIVKALEDKQYKNSSIGIAK